MKSIGDIVREASRRGRKRVAVAAAGEASVLLAVVEAWRLGFAEPVLVGDAEVIDSLGAGLGLGLSRFERVRAGSAREAAAAAVRLVRSGEADFLMKGLVETSVLLVAAFNKETGINAGVLASHVEVLETAAYHKLLFVTDAAINVAPGVDAKLDIVANAARAARSLGAERPKVAVLAALEKVTDKMPATGEAAEVARLCREGRVPGCAVEGPLSLDCAISRESARVKGLSSEVAGDADILVAPDIEAGNVLCKSLLDLGGAKGAGIVMGAAAPIVMASRSDGAGTKLASIAFAALASK